MPRLPSLITTVYGSKYFPALRQGNAGAVVRGDPVVQRRGSSATVGPARPKPRTLASLGNGAVTRGFVVAVHHIEHRRPQAGERPGRLGAPNERHGIGPG
jgi:hypothetical protein